MGLLTGGTSSSGLNLTRRLKRFSTPLSILAFVGGIVYFAVRLWPSFIHDTYMSENALLPGVVDETFSDSTFVREKYLSLKKFVANSGGGKKNAGIPIKWLYDEFSDVEIEAYVQNFTARSPLGVSPEVAGTNFYGVVRSPRGSSNEAIVIAVPYDSTTLPSLTVLLALAKFSRGQIYWAKDLFFVVTDRGKLGMQAWLNAYHGKENTEFMTAGEMFSQSGPIQAAVCLELYDASSLGNVEISYNMINGQLPNLDLFNTVVRLAKKFDMTPTIFGYIENYYSAYSREGYTRFANTAARGILRQAFGSSSTTGLHQVFGQFSIEAVSMRPSQGEQHGQHGDMTSIVRMMEGILRSVNNLLERFHQSFFFYLLLSPHRYMSIGIYMPAVGIMLLAPLIKACALWISISGTDDEKEDKKEEQEKEKISSEKEDEKSQTPKSEETLQKDSEKPYSVSLLDVAPYFIAAHIFGLVLRFLPEFADCLQRSFEISVVSEPCLLAVMACIGLISIFLPSCINLFYGKRASPDLFRCVCLLELGLVVGVLSVINFGLGFVLCLTWVPLFSIISPCKKWIHWSVVFNWIMLAVNPLVVLFAYHCWAAPSPIWYDTVYAMRMGKATLFSIYSMIYENHMYGSWLYTIVTVILYPIWINFWSLSNFSK